MEIEEDCGKPLIEPGPIDPSVLTLQEEHRSTNIWQGKEYNYIWCRRADAPLHRIEGRGPAPPLDDRVMRYIVDAGFYGVHRLGFIRLDHALINALVERWRQETHTFHFPIGEATITLQDIEVLLGLPVDGEAVTGVDDSLKPHEWQRVCQELLGVTPPLEQFSAGRLKLQWLVSQFRQLPADATDATIRCHARAHILALIGGIVLPDRSGNLVKLMYLPLLRDLDKIGTYSWGSAALACLYREMCRATNVNTKEIGGCLILLQLWAWERLLCFQPKLVQTTEHPSGDEEQALDDPFPRGPRGCRWRAAKNLDDVPDHVLIIYRDQLDQLKEDQFLWQPYDLQQLPAYCLHGQAIWMTRSPLVCFERVEWHFPDRVLRQFGMLQMVPGHCDTGTALHKIDRRGRTRLDWKTEHAQYIELWDQRATTLADGVPGIEHVGYTHPYMVWYRECTRLLVGNPSHRVRSGYRGVAGIIEGLTRQLQRIYARCEDAVGEYDAEEIIGDIRRLTMDALGAISEHERLATEPPLQADPTLQQEPVKAKTSGRKRTPIPAADTSFSIKKRRAREPKYRRDGLAWPDSSPAPSPLDAAVLSPFLSSYAVPTNRQASVPSTPSSYIPPSPQPQPLAPPAPPPPTSTLPPLLPIPTPILVRHSDTHLSNTSASTSTSGSPPNIAVNVKEPTPKDKDDQPSKSSEKDIILAVNVSEGGSLQSSTADDPMEVMIQVVPTADTFIHTLPGEEPAPDGNLVEAAIQNNEPPQKDCSLVVKVFGDQKEQCSTEGDGLTKVEPTIVNGDESTPKDNLTEVVKQDDQPSNSSEKSITQPVKISEEGSQQSSTADDPMEAVPTADASLCRLSGEEPTPDGNLMMTAKPKDEPPRKDSSGDGPDGNLMEAAKQNYEPPPDDNLMVTVKPKDEPPQKDSSEVSKEQFHPTPDGNLMVTAKPEDEPSQKDSS